MHDVFAYPTHFVSEDYHIVDDNSQAISSLRVMPNMPIVPNST